MLRRLAREEWVRSTYGKRSYEPRQAGTKIYKNDLDMVEARCHVTGTEFRKVVWAREERMPGAKPWGPGKGVLNFF